MARDQPQIDSFWKGFEGTMHPRYANNKGLHNRDIPGQHAITKTHTHALTFKKVDLTTRAYIFCRTTSVLNGESTTMQQSCRNGTLI